MAKRCRSWSAGPAEWLLKAETNDAAVDWTSARGSCVGLQVCSLDSINPVSILHSTAAATGGPVTLHTGYDLCVLVQLLIVYQYLTLFGLPSYTIRYTTMYT